MNVILKVDFSKLNKYKVNKNKPSPANLLSNHPVCPQYSITITNNWNWFVETKFRVA